MGRTGAGKHSMVAAILRLFEPNGVIRIDGVDTATLSLKVGNITKIMKILTLSMQHVGDHARYTCNVNALYTMLQILFGGTIMLP